MLGWSEQRSVASGSCQLCAYCMDEGPSRDEVCAHPECPTGGGKAFASTRLAPRSPTRPSLVGGPRAEVVPPEDVGPTPHIGTQPSLSVGSHKR